MSSTVDLFANRLAAQLQDGEWRTKDELMENLELPFTAAGDSYFGDVLHHCRMNQCRVLRRELVCDRAEALYGMPEPGDYQPLIQWLLAVIADGKTRAETAIEQCEVWRLNHGGHIPTRVVKKVNEALRCYQEMSWRFDSARSELADALGYETA